MLQELNFTQDRTKNLTTYLQFQARFEKEIEKDLVSEWQLERLFLPGILDHPVPASSPFLLWKRPVHGLDPLRNALADEILSGLLYHYLHLEPDEIKDRSIVARRWIVPLIHNCFYRVGFSDLYDLASVYAQLDLGEDLLFAIVSLLFLVQEKDTLRARYYQGLVKRETPHLSSLYSFLDTGRWSGSREPDTVSGKWTRDVFTRGPVEARQNLGREIFLNSPVLIFECLTQAGMLFRARRFLIRHGNRLHDPVSIDAILLHQDFAAGKYGSYLNRLMNLRGIPGPWVWTEAAFIFSMMDLPREEVESRLQELFEKVDRSLLPDESTRFLFLDLLWGEESPGNLALEQDSSGEQALLDPFFPILGPGGGSFARPDPVYRDFVLRREGTVAHLTRLYHRSAAMESLAGPSIAVRILLALFLCERGDASQRARLLHRIPFDRSLFASCH